MATRQKGEDVVIRHRLDEAVAEWFDCHVYSKRASKKKASETIIAEYLGGRGPDEADREISEQIRGIYAADRQHDTPERTAPREKGREMNEGPSAAHTDPEGYARYEGGVECIEAIRPAPTTEEFRGFCKGNAIKYIWGEGSKGGIRDIYKAADYLGMFPNGKWMHSEEA